jgi:hypothetical protein
MQNTKGQNKSLSRLIIYLEWRTIILLALRKKRMSVRNSIKERLKVLPAVQRIAAVDGMLPFRPSARRRLCSEIPSLVFPAYAGSALSDRLASRSPGAGENACRGHRPAALSEGLPALQKMAVTNGELCLCGRALVLRPLRPASVPVPLFASDLHPGSLGHFYVVFGTSSVFTISVWAASTYAPKRLIRAEPLR